MAPVVHDGCRFPFMTLLPGVLIIGLAACGGGDSGTKTSVASAAVPRASIEVPAPLSDGGHFLGEITIAGRRHNSEALLTVDGAVRIYVGGPSDTEFSSGAFPEELWLHPQESTLFVGALDDVAEASAYGSGVLLGQICDGVAARFCDEPARAEVRLTSTAGGMTGELVITGAGGDERWAVDLIRWSVYYASPAFNVGQYGGAFQERLAPFAQAEEMILEIEPDGRLTFVSASSGCAGNGTVTPHLDGRYDVYDVHLEITGCNAQFQYLNSTFDGLATETQSGYWDYDTWLVIFLAAPDGAPPRPALTMRSHLEAILDDESDPGGGEWDI